MNDVTPILEIKNLKKSFRGHWTFRPIPAVNDVSLKVSPGGAFGFLGHNGAGKTTTIKCILGLTHITSGEVLFEGQPLTAARRVEIGYLPEQPYFYDHLSVRETLDFLCALHGFSKAERNSRIAETLELLEISDRKKSPIRALSKGLQQRLAFSQAIINNPKLLLLDEPFSGLDPIGRHDIRSLIIRLKHEGTTVFMSSHILSDVEDVCERVAIMVRGVLKNVFNLSERHSLFGDSHMLILKSDKALAQEVTVHATKSDIEQRPDGSVTLIHYDSKDAAISALKYALANDIEIEEFKSISRPLEDIFIDSTRESL
jgi:ABC-2 type transport system ATP-binding protein